MSITATPSTTDQPAIEITRWRIDPTRSRVEFRAPTLWGLVTVKGHFADYDGTLDLQRDPAIDLTIQADSLSTNNRARDRHLRSRDFFDVEDHPEVRFVSESARLDGERLTVAGQLCAAGTSTPLKVHATVRPLGGELEVDASAEIDHLALGMSHGLLGMIRTPAQLTVHGRLVRDGE